MSFPCISNGKWWRAWICKAGKERSDHFNCWELPTAVERERVVPAFEIHTQLIGTLVLTVSQLGCSGLSPKLYSDLAEASVWEHHTLGWCNLSYSAHFRNCCQHPPGALAGRFPCDWVPQPRPWWDSPLPLRASLEIPCLFLLPCSICWPLRGFFFPYSESLGGWQNL